MPEDGRIDRCQVCGKEILEGEPHFAIVLLKQIQDGEDLDIIDEEDLLVACHHHSRKEILEKHHHRYRSQFAGTCRDLT